MKVKLKKLHQLAKKKITEYPFLSILMPNEQKSIPNQIIKLYEIMAYDSRWNHHLLLNYLFYEDARDEKTKDKWNYFYNLFTIAYLNLQYFNTLSLIIYTY